MTVEGGDAGRDGLDESGRKGGVIGEEGMTKMMWWWWWRGRSYFVGTHAHTYIYNTHTHVCINNHPFIGPRREEYKGMKVYLPRLYCILREPPGSTVESAQKTHNRLNKKQQKKKEGTKYIVLHNRLQYSFIRVNLL